MKGEVPDQVEPMALGEAKVVREGTDVTIVAIQMMLHRALEAATQLESNGINCEVIDLRSMAPLDTRTVLKSIKKTNRLVIVEEAPHAASWGGDIASLAADEGIYYLEAPVKRVNLGASLIPYSPPLEDHAIPTTERIMKAIRETISA